MLWDISCGWEELCGGVRKRVLMACFLLSVEAEDIDPYKD